MSRLLLMIVVTVAFFAADASAFYSPKQGRFITRDPLGTPLASPEFTPSMSTPIGSEAGTIHSSWQYWDGMSLFQYVGSMPLNRTDPAGLGPIEWLLTGEWDPDPEVLDGAKCGYLEGFGIYPLNTDQSLGQWLYTGDWDASTPMLKASCDAAAGVVDCWEDCMADLHKQLAAVVVGGGAGAGLTQLLGSEISKDSAAAAARRIGMRRLAERFAANAANPAKSNVTTPARTLSAMCRNVRGKQWPTRMLQGFARSVSRRPMLTTAGGAVAGVAWAEAIAGAYCGWKCK